jgi:hypothetical protein
LFIPVSDWFAAFVLTLAVEAPIVVLLLRAAEPNLIRLAVLIVFANLATHLAVWYAFSQLLLVGTIEYTLTSEGWAVAAESLFYKSAIPAVSWRRAIAVAIVANGASALVGRLVLWPMLQPSG